MILYLTACICQIPSNGLSHVMECSFVHSSGYVMISYKIANYLPQGSTHVPLPPHSILAGVVQSMVQSGWVGPFQINSSSHMGSSKLSAIILYITILSSFFSIFKFRNMRIMIYYCIPIYKYTMHTHTYM